MAKAAAQLNLTQPAVSKAIADWTHTRCPACGSQPAGHRGDDTRPWLLRRGAAIFDELRQGVTEIEFLSDPTAGEVRLATSEPYAAGLLPIVIARVSQQHPRVAIYVTQSPIGALQYRMPQYLELRERNVDLVWGR